jgi:hypothetical protein
MRTVPTVRVKFKEAGYEAWINVSDFDRSKHERLDVPAEPKQDDEAPAPPKKRRRRR